MYRQAYLELRELMAQNPELAEKVASEIMGGIEKEASAVPTFTEVMEKVATMFPEEVALLQKIAFNFADAMHAQGLSQEELEKKLGRVAFKNDPVGAVSKKVNQATDAIGTAASGAAGTISDTVLGAGDTVKEVAGGVKETVGKKTKAVKDGIGNIADDIALKGMYAGDAVKDGIKGVADEAALKGMYAGDAVKGGVDDALLKAMYGFDWMKANPGKSALIGGGAAGAGISAVALLNAIKNSKDEKVAAVWNEFIEKKASEKAQVSLPNEILKFAEFKPVITRNNPEFLEAGGLSMEDYVNEYTKPMITKALMGAGVGASAGLGTAALLKGKQVLGTGAAVGGLTGLLAGELAGIPDAFKAYNTDKAAIRKMITNRLPEEELASMSEQDIDSLARRAHWLGLYPDKA